MDNVANKTIRVAVASSDGSMIDQHFGQADGFYIFDVTADGNVAIESRDIAVNAVGNEDKRDTICRMLSDCRVLLVSKIGPTPQEMLAQKGIEATDLYAGRDVSTVLTELFAAKCGDYGNSQLDAGSFKLVHTMLRVRDIERSVDFYTRLLGMHIIERREHQKNQFTQVYLGYDASPGVALELVFNWTREEPYAQSESFGHIAIEVCGMISLCNRLEAAGVAMPRPPRAQRHHDNVVAFIEDPDGHRIELVQYPKTD
jgi:lactoylglutathione lyase